MVLQVVSTAGHRAVRKATYWHLLKGFERLGKGRLDGLSRLAQARGGNPRRSMIIT